MHAKGRSGGQSSDGFPDLALVRRAEELRHAHTTYQDSVAKQRQGEADRRAQEDRRRRNEVHMRARSAV